MFFAIPGVVIFAIAQYTQIEWVVWVAMAFIVIACIVFVIDQME
jgi:hypothetical protein